MRNDQNPPSPFSTQPNGTPPFAYSEPAQRFDFSKSFEERNDLKSDKIAWSRDLRRRHPGMTANQAWNLNAVSFRLGS